MAGFELTPVDGEGPSIMMEEDTSKPEIPDAFLNRLADGAKILDFWKKTTTAMGEGIAEGIDIHHPPGISEQDTSELFKYLGVPEGSRPLHLAGSYRAVAAAMGGFNRLLDAGIKGSAYGLAEALHRTGAEGFKNVEKGRAELSMAGQLAAVLAGSEVHTSLAKIEKGVMGKDFETVIGRLPAPRDFEDATVVVSGGMIEPVVEGKLQRIWETHGIHPAEVLADAEKDPVLKQQLLSSDNASLPEAYGLTRRPGLPDWNNWEDDSKQAIATRHLPNGDVVPAPDAIATYLQEFGRQAGFKFQVGPASQVEHEGPNFQRLEFTNRGTEEKRTQAQVYMPDNPEYQLRNWYGLGRSEILYHEVGHALDYFVLNKEHGITKNSDLPKDLRDEMRAANKQFAPKLWDKNPRYRETPPELMADSIAAWMSNPVLRKQMPLFTAKYGALLDKYLKISEQALPVKVDGATWEMPPGGGEGGKGGGHNGGYGYGGNDFLPEIGGGGGGGKPPGPPGWFEWSGPPEPPGPIRDARDKILSHISIGESTPGRPYSFDRFYSDFVDKGFFIGKEVARAAEKPEGAANDPYKLFRLFSGWAGKADRMLRDGVIDFYSYEKTGPSLKEVLAPIKADLPGFTAFVAAARAMELERRGISTGFDMEAVRVYGQAGIVKYAKAMEGIVKYQNGISKYLRDSGVLSEEGYTAMLDANKLFVPFHTVMGGGNLIERLGIGGSMEARNPVHKIAGSEAIKIDPVESIIKNTYLLTSMAEKNVVGAKLIDMLIKSRAAEAREGRAPEMSRVPQIEDKSGNGMKLLEDAGMETKGGAAGDLARTLNDMAKPVAEDEIAIYRDGRREVYKVSVDLAAAMKNLDAETVGWIEKAMRPFASALRAGSVLTPDFMARHTLRDFTYAFITTTKGIFNPIDLARGFIGLAKEDKDFWNWMSGGGGQVSLVAFDRSYFQENLRNLTDKTGLFTRGWNVVIDPNATWLQKGGAILGLPFAPISRYVIHPLQVGTEFALSASHLAAYKKNARRAEKEAARKTSAPENTPTGTDVTPVDMGNLPATQDYVLAPGSTLKDAIRVDSAGKHQIIESAWVSRNTSIDMQRIGAKMRSYNMISAFANAKIQDTDTVIRLIKDHPIKGGLTIMAGITLPSVYLWTVNHEDSRYQELPQYEKDVFWIFLTDKWEPATYEDAAARPLNRAGMADQVRISNGQYMVNNGAIFRWPKAFGAGMAFGSAVERTLEAYYAHNPDAFKGMLHSMLEVTAGDAVPNALAPIFDQMRNRSGFSGRTIIPSSLEGQLPEYQYTPFTSELAKKLGQTISAFPGIKDVRTTNDASFAGGAAKAVSSPALIENYVRGWTGQLGSYALRLVDTSLQRAGLLPTAVHAPSTLADVPVVRAFVARYPSASTQSVQDFFDGYAVTKVHMDTWKARMKAGDIEGADRVEAMGGDQIFTKLTGYHHAINVWGQMIRGVDADPEIPDNEKRQLIDSYYYATIETAQQGRALMAELKKELEKAK